MVADQRARSRLAAAAGAFASTARNPNLRRAQLSFLGARTAEWAFTVALGIVATPDRLSWRLSFLMHGLDSLPVTIRWERGLTAPASTPRVPILIITAKPSR